MFPSHLSTKSLFLPVKTQTVFLGSHASLCSNSSNSGDGEACSGLLRIGVNVPFYYYYF